MRILLVENDPIDAASVIRALSRVPLATDVRHVSSVRDALFELGEKEYDLILSDLGLDDCVGVQSVVKLSLCEPDCPIIVLTGLQDTTVALKAIREGAQDYLVKNNLSPDLLERSMTYAIQRHQLLRKNTELIDSIREGKRLLESKNRKLQKACDSAQHFVDHVSHEFRTPLTVIMSYASLLQEGLGGEITEKQSSFLKIIDDRAADLNHMVDDMLDVSQLESGLLRASRETCEVKDIFDHVMPAIARKATLRNVDLELTIDNDLPSVFCDEEKAGRVILNLAVNAIKFCGDPGKVQLEAVRRDAHDVEIRVTDNGEGIPPERREEIFGRFSQSKTSLANGVKGFGLGLNIAKELTDLNLGSMGLTSVEGSGTTFTFTIPVDDPIEVASRFLKRSRAITGVTGVLSIFEAQVDQSLCQNDLLDADRFLKHCLHQNDLVIPNGPGRWILLVTVPDLEADAFVNRIEKCRVELNRNRPRKKISEVELRRLGSWSLHEGQAAVLNSLGSQLFTEEACCIG